MRTMMRIPAVVAVFLGAIVALFTTPTQALYFKVTEGQTKCFMETVPTDTLVLGTYNNPDFVPWGRSGFTGIGVHIKVSDPNNELRLEQMADTKGRFAFTSYRGGEHLICFSTNHTRLGPHPVQFNFDLKVDIGEMAIDYKAVAKREELDSLSVEIRKLNDKLKDVLNQQAFQRARQLKFREVSESTASGVELWSVGQTVILILSAIWQLMHLKAFFLQKKRE